MTMITPSYLGETIEYSSLHACRSTLEDPTEFSAGDEERAMEYGREAMRFAESSGSNQLYATACTNLANYACALRDWKTVRAAAAEAIRVSRKTRHHEGLTFGVAAFASLAADRGKYEAAAQLAGFCDARCGLLHAGRQADQSDDILYRRLVAALHENLDPATLERARKGGAAMNEEEAVALAESV